MFSQFLIVIMSKKMSKKMSKRNYFKTMDINQLTFTLEVSIKHQNNWLSFLSTTQMQQG